MKMYLPDQNMIHQNKEFVVIKMFWIYYQINQRVFNIRYHCYFCSQRQDILSHMAQISEHINYSNHRSHSDDKMRKMIANLGSKK